MTVLGAGVSFLAELILDGPGVPGTQELLAGCRDSRNSWKAKYRCHLSLGLESRFLSVHPVIPSSLTYSLPSIVLLTVSLGGEGTLGYFQCLFFLIVPRSPMVSCSLLVLSKRRPSRPVWSTPLGFNTLASQVYFRRVLLLVSENRGVTTSSFLI